MKLLIVFMNDKFGSSRTESSENSNQRAEPTLQRGSALDLDSIESLARKIEGQTEGQIREWAREIAQLAGGLIEQYQQTAHRWAVNEGAHILFEVKECKAYPVSPFLVRRLSGMLFVIEAEWGSRRLRPSCRLGQSREIRERTCQIGDEFEALLLWFRGFSAYS
jgi:hypothetical protein